MQNSKKHFIYKLSLWAAAISVAILTLIPIIDFFLSRTFWTTIPESNNIKIHALTALVFFAAAVASFKNKHLMLGPEPAKKNTLFNIVAHVRVMFISIIDVSFFLSALSLLFIGFEPGNKLFGIPKAVFVSPMAIGLLFSSIANVLKTKKTLRLASLAGIVLALFVSSGALNNIASVFEIQWFSNLPAYSTAAIQFLLIPIIVTIVVLAFMGLPLYTVLAGIAFVLYIAGNSSIELMPSEAYNLFSNENMPAIPLFTLAGFILSESGAGKRLVALFREWFGWMPGGEAFAAVLVCAFFTTFTGANGVAILALGGILATVLTKSASYSEDFTHGYLTASSSVGLLFPPSMAVIIYTVNATFVVQGESAFSITDMFLGGIVPGLLLVLAMAGMGIAKSLTLKAERPKFNLRSAAKASWSTLPEILIPVVILVLYVTGIAHISEIAAIILLYVIIVEGPIRKDMNLKAIKKALVTSIPIVGGSLIIIAVSRGLSFYIMDIGLPERFALWMTQLVSSRFVFLLLLNMALLIVGCFMDIFSAIFVISPLVIPLGLVYGIHPIHLGVIFITNLSIGFLTPPIGMNLFLASYAFGKPVMKIYKDVVPFFVLQLIVLAAITWIPWLSLVFIN